MDKLRTPISPTKARQTPTSALSIAAPLSSSSASSPSSASSSKPPMSSRRSLARNPRLLGLDENGVVELRGLGISSSASPAHSAHPRTSTSSNFSTGRTPLREDHAEGSADDRFRIDEEEEGVVGLKDAETDEARELTSADINNIIKTRQSNDGRRRKTDMLAPIRIDSYARIEGYQAEQGEETAILSKQRTAPDKQIDNDVEREAGISNPFVQQNSNNNEYDQDNQDEEEEEEEEEELNTTLYFEPTTAREKLWMWTSVGLVAILTLVSIAIAVDWIDWPGDGIGNN